MDEHNENMQETSTPMGETNHGYFNFSDNNLTQNAIRKSQDSTIEAAIYYVVVSLLVVGLPGNIAIMVITLRLKDRSSTMVAISYMALFDSLALVSKSITYGLEYNRVHFGVVGCKLYYVPVVASSAIANWTLVLICVERFISVTYPWKRSRLITTKRVHRTVLGLSILMTTYFVIHLCIFFTWNMGKCQVSYSYHAYRLIRQVISTISPCILITVLTILVLRKVSCQKKKTFTVQRETNRGRKQMEETLIRLMLSASIMFFILNIPNILMVSILWPAIGFSRSTGVVVVIVFFYFLRDSSHAFNFYIYFISAKRFRQDFIQLLKDVVCKQK
ncbi:hypothetical protein Btru_054655 [Bulinus truncatus]|nr:hypothetical protein Btru_054655 [Bulinus truncatus]